MNLRDRVLAEDDSKRVAVPTPEWPTVDGELYVQRVSAKAMEAYWESLPDEDQDDDESQSMRVGLVTLATCDAEGTPVFTLEDVDALGDKTNPPVQRLFMEAKDLNELGGDLVKNSESDPADSSPSSSPEA